MQILCILTLTFNYNVVSVILNLKHFKGNHCAKYEHRGQKMKEESSYEQNRLTGRRIDGRTDETDTSDFFFPKTVNILSG